MLLLQLHLFQANNDSISHVHLFFSRAMYPTAKQSKQSRRKQSDVSSTSCSKSFYQLTFARQMSIRRKKILSFSMSLWMTMMMIFQALEKRQRISFLVFRRFYHRKISMIIRLSRSSSSFSSALIILLIDCASSYSNTIDTRNWPGLKRTFFVFHFDY